MMESYWVGALSAVWLGVLTSISPCPLATNIVGISYIGRQVGKPRLVFASGLLYTLGRMLTYSVIAMIIVASLLSIPEVSMTLQKYMNQVLGPLLILVGLVLLEIIKLPFGGVGVGQGVQKRADRWGIWGAGLLGIVFALSFCPVSAGLFFGSLVPLSARHHSAVLFPLLYGMGTALPVIVFAFLLAFGVRSVGKVFNRLTVIELWARRVTGVVFLLVGVYLILSYNLNVIP